MKQCLKRIIRISIAVLLVFNMQASNSIPVSGASSGESGDELIIKLEPNKTINQVLMKYNVSLSKSVQQLGIYKIKLSNNANKDTMLAMLKTDTLIKQCQPNYKYQASFTPNDPNYGLQWGIPDIKLDKAWDTITEKDIIPVAIIDTGINTSHPDLAGKIYSGYNTIANNTNIIDDNGHGTHVAGIAAAVTNNGKGGVGVSNAIRIIPIKALDSTGSGYTTDICEGITWAADHGAKIINLSLGGPTLDPILQEAVDYAYYKGVIVIAAAGNSNVSTPFYPAACTHAVAVSAVDSNNVKAAFSNYGSYIDLAAPGVSIYSTTRDGYYGYMSGTSMASPFVTGAAAYIWSLDSTLTSAQVEQILYSKAVDLGASGKDTYYGYGLIDLYNSVKQFALNTPTPTPLPTSTPTQTSTPTPNPTQTPMTTDNPNSTPIPTVSPTLTPIPTGTPIPTAKPDLKAIGDIDSPVNMETINGTYDITGWFLDDNPLSRLDIIVDNQVIGQATYGEARPDIISKNPGYNNTNCGFRYTLNTAGLSIGAHSLTARETGTNGIQYSFPVITFNTESKNSTNNKISNIIYYLSEDAQVTIGIYDCKDTLVRVLESNASKSAGLNSSQWDGRNSSGIIVHDGVYTYKIQAVDDAGFTSAPATGTIIVERLKPELSLVNDSPDPIYPQKDIISKISYTLSEDADITIDIYDNSNTLVRSLVNTAVCFGENHSEWDGKTSNGTFVKPGTYSYVINATDAFKKKASTVTGTISVTGSEASLKPPVISNNNVSPDNFTPNGMTNVTISYSLSENASVTISIFNSTNTLVNTLEAAVSKDSGNNSCVWNGYDSSNALVPSGNYTYKINAVNSAGLSAIPATGIIKVNKDPILTITLIGDSPDPFDPASAGKNTIEYVLSMEASAEVNLYNNSGVLVKTLFKGQAPAGVNKAVWDGKNSDGAYASEGVYTYKISAVAANGIKAGPISGNISVSKIKKPLILSVNDTPDPLDLQVISQSNITYVLNENAFINLKITDSSGNQVKTLINSNVNSGSNQTTWNGTDDKGNYVQAGLYIYTISATSNSGGEASKLTGTITVSKVADKPDDKPGDKPGDNTSPWLNNNNVKPNPFYPDGSNNTLISYSLLKAARVSLTIFDAGDNEVCLLENNRQKDAGSYSLPWNGTIDTGVFLLSGKYKYLIVANALSGETASVSGEILIAYIPPTITAVNDYPDPFAPVNGNKSTISYTLSKNASTELKIYNSTGALIRTLSGSGKSGINSIQWDGRDVSGNIVKDGKYSYIIEATDTFDKGSSQTNQITVDTAPPVLTLNTISPNPYIITDSNTVSVSYTITKPAIVNIKIYNSQNQLVKVLENEALKPSGKNTAIWSGTDLTDVPVIEGNYKIEIAASGTNGLPSNSVSGTVAVKYPSLVINSFGANPGLLGADGKNLCTITYNISKSANVTVSIFDSSGKLTRNLLNNTKVNGGYNSAAWNGKNSSGAIVASGVYTYTIDATDQYGNKADQKKGTITVDSDPPELDNANAAPDPFTPTE